MSKKQLPTDAIMNELEGASLFFQKKEPVTPLLQVSKPKATEKLELPKPAADNFVALPKKEKDNKLLEAPVTPQPKQITNEETNERTKERSNVPYIHRERDRRKIRHTFDIFADQLMSLREIAIEQEKLFEERVLLGDLVQQALDMFISKERNK